MRHRTPSARALFGAALLDHYLGDDELAEERAVESLALFRRLADPRGVGSARFILGVLAEDRGDFGRAGAMLREARDLLAQAGATFLVIATTFHQGVVAYGRGDLSAAREFLDDALARWREMGDAGGISNALCYLGYIAGDDGDVAGAIACYEEGLVQLERAQTTRTVYFALLGLGIGALAVAYGEATRGVRLLAAVTASGASVGYRLCLPERNVHERAIAAARTRLGEPAFAAAWAAGETLSPDEAVAEAMSLLARLSAAGDVPAATHQDVSDAAAALAARFGLTPRELDVLVLLAEGKSNPAIGDALFISRRTVTTHIDHLYAKLDISTRAEAIALAHRLGLISSLHT